MTSSVIGQRAWPIRSHLSGIALCTGVAALSLFLAALEARWLGRAVIEALVLAIVLGMGLRAAWDLPQSARAGVAFSARTLLEIAVLLLGVTVDFATIESAGARLGAGIVLLVGVGLAMSYAVGRLLGLPHKLAVLVAAGNSICGNSAIAAVAPVVGAEAEQVSAAIAFTAVLGVVVVLGLPLLVGRLHLSFYQYGVLAGLSVYAVPQVLAATYPVSVLSGQVGTLVKLVRVLMLGPVVALLAVVTQRSARTEAAELGSDAGSETGSGVGSDTAPTRNGVTTYVPWFIVGFLLLMGLRSAGLVPAAVLAPVRALTTVLTLVAMAALGLGSDVRAIARAGGRVAAAVSVSLIVLVMLSLLLIRVLGIR